LPSIFSRTLGKLRLTLPSTQKFDTREKRKIINTDPFSGS
jgi:hypothetical protein